MSTDNSTRAGRGPFVMLITIFFFWGFVAASNGVFIPFCKEHFHLKQWQSQLIDVAFYAAYFIGSLILLLFSQYSKVDILNKIGYKKGIVYGLIISVAGAILMVPSVHSGSFGFILGSLFIIALGFSLQQTAAQPFVVALGNPASGAHRLTLAQAINSFGTLTGPLIVSLILFGKVTKSDVTIASIDLMYILLAIVFALAAVLLFRAKLPVIQSSEVFEKEFGALKFPQLRWGMLAIFLYVGVEVTIQSNLGALLKLPSFGSYDVADISRFIALYWGSLMIGRWSGALGAFKIKKSMLIFFQAVVPFLAFLLVMLVNYLKGNRIDDLWIYSVIVAVLVAATFISKEKPSRMITIFAMLGVISVLVGLFTTGSIAMYAFISAGLWCSIGWPCIFALSITGLGKYTGQGSALLVMMILGGALVPLLQGWLADEIGIHESYWVAAVCFIYLAFFGQKVRRILSAQGLDPDIKSTSE